MTKVSEIDGGIGSDATSAVPVRVKTSSTSGMAFSVRLDPELHGLALFQRGRGHAQRLDQHVALIERGHELAAQA